MTLLDAPQFDEAKSRRSRNLGIAGVVGVLLLAVLTASYFLNLPGGLWNWPAEHRVNNFLTAVEAGDMVKAYATWNNDPDWQQHPQKYSNYNFGTFQVDWGSSSDWGVIKTHKIMISKKTGSGTVIGVSINDRKTLAFLWVEGKTHQIGFSPVELE